MRPWTSDGHRNGAVIAAFAYHLSKKHGLSYDAIKDKIGGIGVELGDTLLRDEEGLSLCASRKMSKRAANISPISDLQRQRGRP